MTPKQKNDDAIAIDLFCGMGGLTYGLQKAGLTVRAGIDIDPICQFPYEYNNNSLFLKKDINQLNSYELYPYYEQAKIKILAGCAPCQPFSSYSQGNKSKKTDEWRLLYSFSRLICEIKPEIVTMENVPRVVKHKAFLDFEKSLKDMHYNCWHAVVNCSEYGVPQTRKRLVLLASRIGPIQLLKPASSNNVLTVRSVIGTLPPVKAGEVSDTDPFHKAQNLTELNIQRIQASIPGGTWKDWPESLRARCHRQKSGETYSSVYGRMEWDKESPTITTQFYGYGNGRFGHPEQNRALTLREAAMLQTFPPSYQMSASAKNLSFSQVGKLIGNAVPPALACHIGKSILSHIRSEKIL